MPKEFDGAFGIGFAAIAFEDEDAEVAECGNDGFFSIDGTLEKGPGFFEISFDAEALGITGAESRESVGFPTLGGDLEEANAFDFVDWDTVAKKMALG